MRPVVILLAIIVIALVGIGIFETVHVPKAASTTTTVTADTTLRGYTSCGTTQVGGFSFTLNCPVTTSKSTK